MNLFPSVILYLTYRLQPHVDTFYLLQMNKVPEQSVVVVGTCRNMCPESEVSVREDNKLLHIFEIQEGTGPYKYPKADPVRVIKKYSRPAAGKLDPLPNELRPAPVLLSTTLYLIEQICTKDNQSWERIYEFVFDRLRAVRQDIVIQDMNNEIVVYILQCAVRFHILSAYKLCQSPPADYDEKINSTHIQECLKRLLCLYNRDTKTGSCSCLQGEFLALYLLFNLGAPDALQLAFELKKTVPRDSDFSLACMISLAWNNRNYVRVFKLAKRISPLAQCVLHLHISKIRRDAIKIMSSGYNSKNLTFAVGDLTKLLNLGNKDRTRELCTFYGLEVNDSLSVKFNKSSFKEEVLYPMEKEQWIEDRISKIPITRLLKGHTCRCMEEYMSS